MKSRIYRIRFKREFELVSTGKFFQAYPLWFRYIVLESTIKEPVKVGFAVSKRYGNAVVRNKLKRRIREVFFRKNKESEILNSMIILVGHSGKINREISYSEVNDGVTSFIKHIS